MSCPMCDTSFTRENVPNLPCTCEPRVGYRGERHPDPALAPHYYSNEGLQPYAFNQDPMVCILRRLYALERTFAQEVEQALHHADSGDVRNTSRILRNVLGRLGKVPGT